VRAVELERNRTGWKPALLGPFFAREVFRVEEKAEPFTKDVKSVAPENSTKPQGWFARSSSTGTLACAVLRAALVSSTQIVLAVTIAKTAQARVPVLLRPGPRRGFGPSAPIQPVLQFMRTADHA
jgi:hypothetical protein